MKTTIYLLNKLCKSPTLIELDINTKPEVNFTFKSIGHNGGNSSVHEEISGATDHRDIPSLLQGRVGSSQGDGSTMISAVENKRESKPRSEGVLGVVNVRALCPTDLVGVKVVVQRDGVVENHYVSEVELARQFG